MQFIASKHCNHGKKSEQLGTKSKSLSTRKRQASAKEFQSKNKNDIWKVLHSILNPNPKALEVDP